MGAPPRYATLPADPAAPRTHARAAPCAIAAAASSVVMHKDNDSCIASLLVAVSFGSPRYAVRITQCAVYVVTYTTKVVLLRPPSPWSFVLTVVLTVPTVPLTPGLTFVLIAVLGPLPVLTVAVLVPAVQVRPSHGG